MSSTKGKPKAGEEKPANQDRAQPAKKARDLTPKQKLFADEYIGDAGLNATAAYKRAGYSASTDNIAGVEAHKLLKNPKIAAYIAQRMNERQKRTEITQDYVLKTIYETVERCKQATPVFDKAGNPVLVETPDGEIAPAYAFDSKAVLKGAELLGRHLGIFNDKVKLQGDAENPLVVSTKVVIVPAKEAAPVTTKKIEAGE